MNQGSHRVAYKRISILLLGLTVLFGGCLNLEQPREKIAFYTLEYDPPQMADLEPLRLVIRMERFSIAPTYNTNLIIYRDSSFKRDSYVYHKWRTDPGALVSHFLSRDIRQSGLFKAVLHRESRFSSSYMLEGSVDEFFEWDLEETWNAVLSVSITLMAENEPDVSKRIIFQKTYSSRKACKQKNPQALAEAMSWAMAEVSKSIIKDIYSHLKDRTQKNLGSN